MNRFIISLRIVLKIAIVICFYLDIMGFNPQVHADPTRRYDHTTHEFSYPFHEKNIPCNVLYHIGASRKVVAVRAAVRCSTVFSSLSTELDVSVVGTSIFHSIINSVGDKTSITTSTIKISCTPGTSEYYHSEIYLVGYKTQNATKLSGSSNPEPWKIECAYS